MKSCVISQFRPILGIRTCVCDLLSGCCYFIVIVLPHCYRVSLVYFIALFPPLVVCDVSLCCSLVVLLLLHTCLVTVSVTLRKGLLHEFFSGKIVFVNPGERCALTRFQI